MLRTFFNERATIWDQTIAEKDSDKLEKMACRLEIKVGSSLLDVGTGTGVMVPYLLRRIGMTGRLVALDFAEEMLKISKSKGFFETIDLLHADISLLPLSENTFDTVVCYSSFPHFHDKPKALAEIHRVVRNRGWLYICHTSSRFKINSIHTASPVLKNDLLPDAEEMLGMLSMAGFGCVKIEDENDHYLACAQKTKG
jgi:ubiquinone/menaquinone biosynthesis C-methylase UbiE